MRKKLDPKYYTQEEITDFTANRWSVGVPNLAGGYDLIENYPTKREAVETANNIRQHKGVRVVIWDNFQDDGSYMGC